MSRVWQSAEQELCRQYAYLFPLRLFIGLGWIRAGLEKFITPGWSSGTALSHFFTQQVNGGRVVFPFYHQLINTVFGPNVAVLSWIIMVGQILVGLCIVFGVMTNFALMWGLFMNVNFVLIGQVDPSAFYIVIQTVLYVTNVGAIFGMDRLLSRYIPTVFLTAQPSGQGRDWQFESAAFFGVAIIASAIGVAAVPYIRDYSPHSVDDPAMLMLILSGITSMTATIKAIRIRSRMVEHVPVRAELPPLSRSLEQEASPN